MKSNDWDVEPEAKFVCRPFMPAPGYRRLRRFRYAGGTDRSASDAASTSAAADGLGHGCPAECGPVGRTDYVVHRDGNRWRNYCVVCEWDCRRQRHRGHGGLRGQLHGAPFLDEQQRRGRGRLGRRTPNRFCNRGGRTHSVRAGAADFQSTGGAIHDESSAAGHSQRAVRSGYDLRHANLGAADAVDAA